MDFQERIKQLALPETYFEKVAHPLSDLSMPIDDKPFIIQPSRRFDLPFDRRELSARAFARSLQANERSTLLSFFEDSGSKYFEPNSISVLAVGTKVFTPRAWLGVEKFNELGGESEFSSILERSGEDIDLVLLCNDIQKCQYLAADSGNDIPTWAVELAATVDSHCFDWKVSNGYENGAFYFDCSLSIERNPETGEQIQVLDERPFRHKFRASGISLSVQYEENGPIIHIRPNFSATADKIIAIEREQRFCFSELFLNGEYGSFTKVLSYENQQKTFSF